MSTEVTKRTRRSYTEAEIQRGLTEVAACSGNTKMAAERLAADPDSRSVPQNVLWEWTHRRYVGDYERIRRDYLPAINAQVAEQSMALARQFMEGEEKLGAELVAESSRLEPRDKVNAFGKLGINKGIAVEKALLLTGQATSRVEHLSSAELLREFQAEGIGFTDGEILSEETVEDAEVVESLSAAVTASPIDADS